MGSNNHNDWSDMDDFDNARVKSGGRRVPGQSFDSTIVGSMECPKCKGTGNVTIGYANMRVVSCFTCQGTGRVTQERLNRQAGARKAKVTREQNRVAGIAAFREANPELAEWLDRKAAKGNFRFASDLHAQLNERGKLSEKQVAALVKCKAREDERNAAFQAEREAAAPKVEGEGADALSAFFAKAKAKRPKVRTANFVFSKAPDTGRNAGAVYVKARTDGEYIGKIANGKFFSSRAATPDDVAKVAEVMRDPLAAAVAFGRESGTCSVCGRELTDPASIAAGIGPVCAAGF